VRAAFGYVVEVVEGRGLRVGCVVEGCHATLGPRGRGSLCDTWDGNGYAVTAHLPARSAGKVQPRQGPEAPHFAVNYATDSVQIYGQTPGAKPPPDMMMPNGQPNGYANGAGQSTTAAYGGMSSAAPGVMMAADPYAQPQQRMLTPMDPAQGQYHQQAVAMDPYAQAYPQEQYGYAQTNGHYVPQSPAMSPYAGYPPQAPMMAY
jgi:hypothetical protein